MFVATRGRDSKNDVVFTKIVIVRMSDTCSESTARRDPREIEKGRLGGITKPLKRVQERVRLDSYVVKYGPSDK